MILPIMRGRDLLAPSNKTPNRKNPMNCVCCQNQLQYSFENGWRVYCSNGKCASIISNQGILIQGEGEDGLKVSYEKLNSLIEREMDYARFIGGQKGDDAYDAFQQFIIDIFKHLD